MTHQRFAETTGIALLLFSVPCLFLGYFPVSLGLFATGAGAYVYSRATT